MVRFVALAAAAVFAGACNPFGCGAESRSAEYQGRVGGELPPGPLPALRPSGFVDIQLGESRGTINFRSIGAFVTYYDVTSAISAVRIWSGTTASPKQRLLWESNRGLAVRDSFWNAFPADYGYSDWDRLWNELEGGNGFIQLVAPDSMVPSLVAPLRRTESAPFAKSCPG